ncbi:MAG: hypothetical protein PHE49_09495 [bacterium]|nr:hypothetical protein [bacterium]
MKKEIPSWVLFLIAVVCYVLAYFIGDIIGSAFGVLGLICLVLSIVRFLRELKNRKNKNKI